MSGSSFIVTFEVSTADFKNSTTAVNDSFAATSTGGGSASNICSIPNQVVIVAMIILVLELLTGILTNLLLVATICNSPSLKTPPNALLVNICCNNLLLTLCMLFSLVSFTLSLFVDVADNQDTFTIMGNLQLFLTVICFLQYCTIFTSIGYYRCKTVKVPSKSATWRAKIISKSVIFGWMISMFLGLLVTISFREPDTALGWNPFCRDFIVENDCESLNEDINDNLDGYQVTILYITLIVIILLFAIIIKSYHYIIKTLFRANAVCKNRVTPWVKRTSSDSSDGNDLMGTSHRSYKPEESADYSQSQRSTFMISNGHVLVDNFMVHYQKRNNSISFADEVFALENPMKAQSLKLNHHHTDSVKKKQLTSQLSTASQGSTKSNNLKYADFTDISPGAQLSRFQSMKNKRALQNQSLRRDRVSLSGATKNSIVMITTFFLCSCPGFICSIPGVLKKEGSVVQFTQALIFCQLVFYINAPAYPIWYLVFSKRVRKCLLKIYDSALIKFKIKQ